jgi:radical SAM superfamily enzyme YgiQ (UPF0313 family)
MGKPGPEVLEEFTARFQEAAAESSPKKFLTYYFMAAHPSCRHEHMVALGAFARRRLHLRPEQIQIFTPTPSTRSTAIFHTGKDPFTGEPVFVERCLAARVAQKAAVLKP